MHRRNPGIELDVGWVNNVKVNLPAVNQQAENLASRRSLKGPWQAAWLLRAVTCVDASTLAGDATSANVQRLCYKLANPVREDIMKRLGMEHANITCGAVCVYPARVKVAAETMKKIGKGIPVAAVATGFPSGQFHLTTRLEEIRLSVQDGASEIDIVINREMALCGNWEGLYEELKEMRKACGDASMRTILAVGELGSMNTVYKASLVAMMAGSDLLKTSTGKEVYNATIPVGIVMCRAIREYYRHTGYKVGFKPSGGIRTSEDALLWLILTKEELGNEWLNKDLFRIGASALLTDLERQLFHHAYGRYAAASELPMS